MSTGTPGSDVPVTRRGLGVSTPTLELIGHTAGATASLLKIWIGRWPDQRIRRLWTVWDAV